MDTVWPRCKGAGWTIETSRTIRFHIWNSARKASRASCTVTCLVLSFYSVRHVLSRRAGNYIVIRAPVSIRAIVGGARSATELASGTSSTSCSTSLSCELPRRTGNHTVSASRAVVVLIAPHLGCRRRASFTKVASSAGSAGRSKIETSAVLALLTIDTLSCSICTFVGHVRSRGAGRWSCALQNAVLSEGAHVATCCRRETCRCCPDTIRRGVNRTT